MVKQMEPDDTPAWVWVGIAAAALAVVWLWSVGL